jgi:hypothetical protein
MWRFPLLVLLYVALDFANPLMPGAVRFERGLVESVQADRVARSPAAVMPAPATLRTERLLPPEGAPGTPAPTPAEPGAVRRHVRRAAAPDSDPAPSPTDDH